MDSHQSTFSIQVWKEQGGEKLQWQECNLKSGSSVEVAVSERDNYWIWENVLKSGEMFWLFRPRLDQDLYVTFEDSGQVTTTSKRLKSYFKVYIAYDGYIINAPGTQNYLAVKNGVLALSDVPVVWSLKLQYAKKTKPYAKIISLEGDKTVMWVCNRPVEGAWITVEKSTPDTDKALWYVTPAPLVIEGYRIRPKLNEDLFVTNDVSTNSVTLEHMGSTLMERRRSIIRTKVVSSSARSVHLLNMIRTRYIFVEQEGKNLALTDNGDDAVKVIVWKPPELYTFGRDGQSTPPDLKPRCEAEASEEAAIQRLDIE